MLRAAALPPPAAAAALVVYFPPPLPLPMPSARRGRRAPTPCLRLPPRCAAGRKPSVRPRSQRRAGGTSAHLRPGRPSRGGRPAPPPPRLRSAPGGCRAPAPPRPARPRPAPPRPGPPRGHRREAPAPVMPGAAGGRGRVCARPGAGGCSAPRLSWGRRPRQSPRGWGKKKKSREQVNCSAGVWQRGFSPPPPLHRYFRFKVWPVAARFEKVVNRLSLWSIPLLGVNI